MKRLLSVIVVLVIVGQLSAQDQDTVGFELVGQYNFYPTSLASMELIGNLLFLGSNGEGYYAFQIWDISNPQLPEIVGIVDEQPDPIDNVHDIQITDTLAYIACDEQGIRIINISDPFNPRIIGVLEDIDATSLCVEDELAYVMTDNDGLYVLDISSPEIISVVSHNIDGASRFLSKNPSTVIIDNYLYSLNRYLAIYDISDRRHPELIANMATDEWLVMDSYAIENNNLYAFVQCSDGDDAMVICNLTDLNNIHLMISHIVDDHYSCFKLIADKLFTACNDKLIEFEFEFPYFRIVSSTQLRTDNAITLESSGNRLILASDEAISFINIANLDDPDLTSTYFTKDSGYNNILLHNNFLILAGGKNGLCAMEILDRNQPFPIWNYQRDYDSRYSESFALSGDILFATAPFRPTFINIIDLTDIRNPHQIGRYDENLVELRSINIRDTILIASGYFQSERQERICGISAYSISDANNIEYLGSCDIGGNPNSPYDVAVNGDMAYLAADYGGLYIFDISDPRNIVQIGNLVIQDYADHDIRAIRLAVFGDYVLVGGNGLYIIDVSDPENLVRVASYGNIWMHCFGLKVVDNTVIYSDAMGLHVLDLSEPENPILIAHLSDRFNVANIEVSGSKVYAEFVADRSLQYPMSTYGIKVFDFSPGEFVHVEAENRMTPHSISLLPAYPNPFNSRVTIPYRVGSNSNSTVQLSIYDQSGRLVDRLNPGYSSAGMHTVTWDAAHFPTGIYFITLNGVNAQPTTQKIILMK